jgi:hypothetical protein
MGKKLECTLESLVIVAITARGLILIFKFVDCISFILLLKQIATKKSNGLLLQAPGVALPEVFLWL